MSTAGRSSTDIWKSAQCLRPTSVYLKSATVTIIQVLLNTVIPQRNLNSSFLTVNFFQAINFCHYTFTSAVEKICSFLFSNFLQWAQISCCCVVWVFGCWFYSVGCCRPTAVWRHWICVMIGRGKWGEVWSGAQVVTLSWWISLTRGVSFHWSTPRNSPRIELWNARKTFYSEYDTNSWKSFSFESVVWPKTLTRNLTVRNHLKLTFVALPKWYESWIWQRR